MSIFKKFLVALISTILILTTLVGAFVLTGITTPNLLPFILRSAWDDVSTYMPEEYLAIKEDVTVVKDLIYPSKYNENKLDIYYANDAKDKQQTILWIHGGGFVSGSKNGQLVFASLLAKEGFTVIAMNYELAPESVYPAPLIQVGESIKYLRNNNEKYPTMDLKRLTIGGDSAGAHIAANFAAIETNINVSKELNIPQVLEYDIESLLLYCGPFDLMKFSNMFSSNSSSGILDYFVNQVGWSYFGFKNWLDKDIIKQTNIIDIITTDFPPTYITDGNKISFMDHGIELANKLEVLKVKVETYFPSEKYPNKDYFHEYQFDFENFHTEAFENLNNTIQFLRSF